MLFVLSLLCKTVTATLPAALLVVFWWRRGRISWRRDVLPLVPWLAVGAAAGLFSSWVERAYVGAQGADFDLSPAGTGAGCRPGDLLLYRQARMAGGLELRLPALDGGRNRLVAVAFPPWGPRGRWAVLWALRRRARAAAGRLPHLHGFALPGVELREPLRRALLVGVGPLAVPARSRIDRARGLWPRRRLAACGTRPAPAGPALAAALALLLGALTWSHCAMFSDVETLWSSTLARNPSCWMAYNNLAAHLLADGRPEEAMKDVQASLRFGPGNASAYATLGDILSKEGRLNEALSQYERALEIEPNNVLTHTNLGSALLQAGRVDEAVAHFERALVLEPDLAKANAGLGDACLRSGRTDEAIAHFTKALEFDPADVSALANQGVALAQKGRADEAISC